MFKWALNILVHDMIDKEKLMKNMQMKKRNSSAYKTSRKYLFSFSFCFLVPGNFEKPMVIISIYIIYFKV